LVVLEAMKMEHPVIAPQAGIIGELLVAPGALVAAGDVLVVLLSGDEEP
jgi:acetyl-CoA/propionyl-CoA carboxylase biotin carboxyl carrier protein